MSSHNHDGTYVKRSGDSMSGTLNINSQQCINAVSTAGNWCYFRMASGGLMFDIATKDTNGGWLEFRVNGTDTRTYIDRNAYIYSPKFIKIGGNSTQFLKADGSVDTNTYLTVGAASSTYVHQTGDTMTGPLIINSSVNGNYNEGIRISRAGNSWAGITFGSVGTTGKPTGGWFVATNPSAQFIITPDDSSNSTGLCLNKSGDIKWRNWVIYHTNNFPWTSLWVKGGSWLSTTLQSEGYTRVCGIVDSTASGEFALAYLNNKISPYADGWFYQNEGRYRCLDSSDIGNKVAPQSHTHPYLPLSGGTLTGTLHITAPSGSYTEGIRISESSGKWSTIVLGAVGTSGTNANSWSIHRTSNYGFSISRNSSDGNNGLYMNATGMGLGTTSPSYRLDISGTCRATKFLSDTYGPGFEVTVSSGWAYMKYMASSYEWHIGVPETTTGKIGQAGAFEIRSQGDGSSGIAIRRNTSSYGKLVITSSSTESSIGYCNSTSGATNPMWTAGAGIGGSANYFGWWYQTSGCKMFLTGDGTLYVNSNQIVATQTWTNGLIGDISTLLDKINGTIV